MAKPITFSDMLDLLDSFPFSDSEQVKVNMKTNGAACTIYDGNSKKVPDYLIKMYGENVVENVTTPFESIEKKKHLSEIEDSEKVIHITLMQPDYNLSFGDVFYGHEPDDYLCVIARDIEDHSKEKQLFAGKMSELPVLLFDDIQNVPVFIDVPYSDEWSGAVPQKHTIIVKANL